VRSKVGSVPEAYSPYSSGLAGILHDLITDNLSPEPRPEDMGRTYDLFLKDKAGRSRNVISPAVVPSSRISPHDLSSSMTSRIRVTSQSQYRGAGFCPGERVSHSRNATPSRSTVSRTPFIRSDTS